MERERVLSKAKVQLKLKLKMKKKKKLVEMARWGRAWMVRRGFEGPSARAAYCNLQ